MARATPHVTHEVLNQVPPLACYDVADDPRADRGSGRGSAGGHAAPGCTSSACWRVGAGPSELARLANVVSPGAAHPRPLRPPDRRGRVPPRLARADGHRGRPGLHAAPWADDRAGRARGPRGPVLRLDARPRPGHGCPISMTYAVVPGAARTSRRSPPYEPLLAVARLRSGPAAARGKAGLWPAWRMTEKQGGSDVRANTTARRAAAGGRQLPAHRPQVVLLGADVRRLPGAGPGGRRADLLPPAAGAAGRHPQRHAHAAAEGQAGQPVQRLGRDRVRRRARLARRARRAAASPPSSRWSATTRLDCVLGSAAAMRQARARRRTTRATAGVRRAADRPAADDARAGRPGARVRGGHGAGDAAGRGVRRGAATAEAACCGSALPSPSTGSASARPRPPTRHWSAWAATATSRSRRCRGCYREAPLNSIWEGSGNVIALDVLRALARDPGPADALFAEIDQAAGADRRLDAAAGAACAASSRTPTAADGTQAQYRARMLAALIATALQASLLVRHAPAAVADAFCASRLGPDGTAPPPGPAGRVRHAAGRAQPWPPVALRATVSVPG